MGATSPGRWQLWQFFCRIGRTSLLNVTFGRIRRGQNDHACQENTYYRCNMRSREQYLLQRLLTARIIGGFRRKGNDR